MRRALACLIAVLSLAVAVGASEAVPSCPATISGVDPGLQRVYAEFKRSMESSPLAWRLGRPVSCEARADGSAIHLTYASPTGARLEAHRDPAIEFTEQRLSEKGMSTPVAVALLQRTERWAFGDKGCSIAWTHRAESEATPGGREIVYRGHDCNCQARVLYVGHAVTAVIFRSAC